jgi:cytoskeletal protein CcmA (bactofilin family)
VKVLGDAEADVAELEGLVSVKGALRGGSVSVRGTLEVGGIVEVSGRLDVDGESELNGIVRCGEWTSRGQARAMASVSATTSIRSVGNLEVRGLVTTPKLSFEGRVRVDGELRATEVDGTLKGESTLSTLRCDRVVIRGGGRLGPRSRLVITEVEAKEATLEAVEVEYLRADRIVLGPHAQVARLDGKVVQQHPSAHVGPVSRTPKPYGLTR